MLPKAIARGGIEGRLAVSDTDIRSAIDPHEGEERERAFLIIGAFAALGGGALFYEI